MIIAIKVYLLLIKVYLGAYELIELDIYAYIASYEMFEWIKCLSNQV